MKCEICGKECEAVVVCTEKDESGHAFLSHKTKCCGSYSMDIEIGETFDLKPQNNIEIPAARMSLRDYFAIRAPQPPKWWIDSYGKNLNDLQQEAELISTWNYAYADTMLEARKK